jgi:AcrR family transcriptional regulator
MSWNVKKRTTSRKAVKKRASASDHDSKEILYRVALKQFAQKGFDGASVKSIAQEAKMNVSLISYYFEGKEGLLREALERFGNERLQDARNLLTPPESVEDMRVKLRVWLLQFLNCHVDDPHVCGILHRENPLEKKFMFEVFQKTFLKSFEAVAEFFRQAKKRHLIRDLDPMFLAASFFANVIHLGKNQKLQQMIMGVSIQDEKYRSLVADQIIDLHFFGILQSKENS